MTDRGRLSFEEFVEIQPESREIQEEGNSYRISGFNLLVSGSVVPDEDGNLVPEGDMYVRAVSIAYLAYDSAGNLVDISDSLRQARVEQITIVGLGKSGVLVLPVGDLEGNPTRVDRGSYMVLRTLPTLIDALPEILPGEDGDHPHWNDIPSIHFDYLCEEYRRGNVTIEPAFVVRVMSDEYNIVLNNVMDIRSNVHVRKVEDENWIDRHSTTNRTGSVNLDFYTDLGIGKSRFTGTKNWGNYKVSSSGEWFGDMKAEMQAQLTSGMVVDPAFQTYIGFSGSIIQSGSIQEDISAGTADFEELKFTKLRVRRREHDLEGVEVKGYEYVMSIDEVSKLQPEGSEVRDLPEEKDILYRRIPSSSNFSRVVESLVYIADSNKIYKTDKFGEVVLIRDYKQG